MEIRRNWCSEHVIFIMLYNFNFFLLCCGKTEIYLFFLSLSVKLSTAGGREKKNLVHLGFSTAPISLVREHSEDIEPERGTEMKICQLVHFREVSGSSRLMLSLC